MTPSLIVKGVRAASSRSNHCAQSLQEASPTVLTPNGLEPVADEMPGA